MNYKHILDPDMSKAKRYYFGYPKSEINPEGKPLPTQKKFHQSRKRYRLYAGGFGTGKCLHEDSQVLTTDGLKSIKSVKPGDYVSSYDEWLQKYVWSQVLDRIDSGMLDGYKVTLSPFFKGEYKPSNMNEAMAKGELSVIVSEYHPFYKAFGKEITTEYGDKLDVFDHAEWTEFNQLKIGDCVACDWWSFAISPYKNTIGYYNCGNAFLPIKSIEPVGKVQMYDLEIEDTHNFVANGILVHNTTALCIEAVKDIAIPFNRVLMGRKDLGEFKNTTLQELFSLIPPEMIRQHDQQGKTIHFINGTQVVYLNLDDARSAVDKIKSLNLGAAHIDQQEEIEESIFLAIKGRLRRKNTRRCYCATNNPEGHNWEYRYWKEQTYSQYIASLGCDVARADKIVVEVQKKIEDYVSHKVYIAPNLDPLNEACKGYEYDIDTIKTMVNKYDFELFEAITLENKYLPPDYVQGLLQYPERWVKRFVYCSWDDFEGLVYDQVKEALHKLNGIYTPSEHDRHFIFLDYGFRNPTAAIFVSIDYDENVTIWGEYYQAGKLIDQIVKEIKELNPYFSKALKFADPSIWNRQMNGTSVADEFQKYGMILFPADNNVLQGINRVNTMFKEGRITVGANCVNWWREVGNYKWKEIKPGMQRNDYEEPTKKDDHLMDATRYMVNNLYKPVKPKEQEPINMPGTYKRYDGNNTKKDSRIRF